MTATATTEAEREAGSFRSVVKATSVMGGASVANILIGMVRTKFVAVLLGPAGVGLLGAYNQIIGLLSTFVGVGLDTSGVRQVAQAAGTNDETLIATTVITLRRTAWITGGAGIVVMAALALPISRLSFGDANHAVPIAVLGISLLAGQVSAAQSSVVRGMRRVADVARITVISAMAGTAVSIPCYYLWGVEGIVPALLLTALASLIASWAYGRRIVLKQVRLRWAESRAEARALVTLGVSFMAGGLITSGGTYLVQVLILRRFGVSGFGIYQAAFALSGVLAAFVLHALSVDYYPRLSAVAADDAQVRAVVNEQTQVATMLALPGLAAMVVFAPMIIRLFYAPAFAPSATVLGWCVIGVMGKVFSFPLGFVILAKGYGRLYLITETLAAILHVATVAVLTRYFSVAGAGAAFATMYLGYTALMILVTRRVVAGWWTRVTLKINVGALGMLFLLLANVNLNGHAPTRWFAGVAAVIVTTFVCIWRLMHQSGLHLGARFAGSSDA